MSFLATGERAAVTAKARIYRGRLLSPSDYARLLDCETVGEIAAYLARTESYAPYLAALHPEGMHRGELEGVLTVIPLLEEIPFCHYLGPGRKVLLRAWGERFDGDIIKRMLRILATGRGSLEALRSRTESVPLTLVDREKLFASRTFRDVLAALEGSPLREILADPLKRAEKEGKNLFRAKMALDSFFLTRILSAGKKLSGSEGRGVRTLFGTRADLINLYWIYRGRRFFAMSPEEALSITLPVRYRLSFQTLSTFAFAPDIPSLVDFLSRSVYGEAFRIRQEEEVEVSEMALEHNLYRILRRTAAKIFSSGTSGVHVVLAYLTLKELEVKDLFTIIEDVRYHYDRKKAREFLIFPDASALGRSERGDAPWPS